MRIKSGNQIGVSANRVRGTLTAFPKVTLSLIVCYPPFRQQTEPSSTWTTTTTALLLQEGTIRCALPVGAFTDFNADYPIPLPLPLTLLIPLLRYWTRDPTTKATSRSEAEEPTHCGQRRG